MSSNRLLLSRRQALTGGALVAAAHLGVGAAAPAAAAAGKRMAAGPTVRRIPMNGVDAVAARRLTAHELEDVSALSATVPATGLAAVGVTWAPGTADTRLRFLVRTQTGGTWSPWQPMRAQGEHGPTTGSAEGRRAVPGTDPVIVGSVDAVQVKVVGASGAARPADLTLSVVDPGQPPAAQLSAGRQRKPAYRARRSSRTSRPAIYSRAQWGADESMRNGFAGYGEIRAGFVHHTVNANDYSRDDVPAILRGIYAYHTQSQGWSDVGYNFLVDRFGRIWEGRWGGIRRPVIGAHTSGFNEEGFAMSAIGNFEVAQPTKEMIRAYRRLFAWKLSRHGVDGDASTTIDGARLRTISGHRDAGSTACPGQNLYADIPRIRRRVAARQAK